MIFAPVDSSQRRLYAVYIFSALLLSGIVAGLRLSIPDEIASYVTNGLILPFSRYGILFPLIAYGIVLSGEHRPLATVANIAVLVLAALFGLQHMGPAVFSHPWGWLIVKYPILFVAMGVITGGALLVPLRARRWLVPIVSAGCGLGTGLSIFAESPANEYASWFTSAGGIGAMAIVVASGALTLSLQRIGPGAWFLVVGRILGSWLIAASLMLAALAFVPKHPRGSTPMPIAVPEDVELSRQP